ncbi:hypothetical protein FRC03_002155 [Tulasnella sp. 419]|nr:hypothetical protein FRC02_001913 [Tulasnella sp. 418]KAG8964147.1 hypothetical protein FRC03_002155 [Tulasnella sp. 419]
MPVQIPVDVSGPLTYHEMLKERQKLLPASPCIGHVNLQMDSFLASVNADELRAVCRQLLATSDKATQNVFTNVARTRMLRQSKKPLPSRESLFKNAHTNDPLPTQVVYDTLARARSIFGVGLGFESLHILLFLIRSTSGLRWELDSKMEDALIVLDADLAQAIQSCKEQVASKVATNQPLDLEAYRHQLKELKTAMEDIRKETDAWGGEFPYEKGLISINGWRL